MDKNNMETVFNDLCSNIERKKCPDLWPRVSAAIEPTRTVVPKYRSLRAVAFAAAVQEVLGREPAFIASPGTYDQKHVVRLGGITDCIAYGPGRLVTAHMADEHVVVDELVASTKVMALAAFRLLGTA